MQVLSEIRRKYQKPTFASYDTLIEKNKNFQLSMVHLSSTIKRVSIFKSSG